MSRTKGTYTLTSNIEPKVGAPLDARTIVKLKTDLTANGTFEYPYIGLTVFVTEENKKYTLIGIDPTVLTNWTEESGSGGGHTIEKSDGTDMTSRTNLQFIDAQISDDSNNNRTKVENVKVISSESELADLPDGIYMSNSEESVNVTAVDVTYDNTTSGLDATTVQEAIDEVVDNLGSGTADSITYDNTTSGLEAENVQDALDEIAENLGSGTADDITYDNTTSGLQSTNVQDAIDEVVNSITGGHTIEKSDGTDMTQRTNLQFLDSQVTDDLSNDRTKIENIKVISSESELASLPDGLYISNTDEQTYVTSADVTYDNTTSGLDATTVQEAIDEVVENMGSGSADGITYDNTASGLDATTVQEAIDEIVDGGISSGHTIEKSDGTDMTQRTNLQFLDAQLSDDSSNDRTKIENVKTISSESELANLPDGIYLSNTDEQTYVTSADVTYDNTTSGLQSTNVQEAIDELKATILTLQNIIANLNS